jgi:HAD superfamily hydrolase (TIGR01549 family)
MGVADAVAKSGIRVPVKSIRVLRTLSVPLLDRRPAGLVFDLDDTLVDHKIWMLRKALAAYRSVAGGWTPEEDFRLHMLQLVDEGERGHLIDELAEGLGWSREQHQAYLEAYRTIVLPDTPLFADVAPALATLAAAGLRIGILTDNPPATQRGKLAHAPALSCVDSVVFTREAGGEKPGGKAFLAVAGELGLPPGELAMVGDNWFRDAFGAIRAGFAHAFVLQRQGGFVQPHPGVPAWAGLSAGEAARIHRIDGLPALLASVLCDPPTLRSTDETPA